jgi:LuxR family maltose regulon positive regulatory protein
MPQMTAVKILLAQDTTDSLRQAADLLDQLNDFFTSIHNNCFQIDVLAMQALLHDARGQDSAALVKLSQALDLAEPGGFIRLFVDLGSRMADLLKRLIKQNVAVDYAGRILAAFRQDESRSVPDPNSLLIPPSDFPHPPLSQPVLPSLQSEEGSPGLPAAQTLADPLTNRELDVLELLGQRLQNKEIAANLFISPETVKKHLNNLYGKLNVSGRRQAVSKAMDLGIVTRR